MATSKRLVIPILVLAFGAKFSAFGQTIPAPARPKVIDETGFFSKSAVESATRALTEIQLSHDVPVVIEVIKSLGSRSIEDAALAEARRTGGGGLFVLIAKEERKLRILTRPTVEGRYTPDRVSAIREAFLNGLKSGNPDEGLAKGVAEIAAIAKATESLEAPAFVRDRVRLTLAGARNALEAAEAKAAEIKINANIAVVDDGGHLIAFARMDGARPASAATAQTKAISAATMRQATGPLPNGAATPDLIISLGLPGAAASGGAKVTTLLGGVPIIIDGQVIGAVGVGGGTGEQDAEIAKAGAAAISEPARASRSADK